MCFNCAGRGAYSIPILKLYDEITSTTLRMMKKCLFGTISPTPRRIISRPNRRLGKLHLPMMTFPTPTFLVAMENVGLLLSPAITIITAAPDPRTSSFVVRIRVIGTGLTTMLVADAMSMAYLVLISPSTDY